MKTSGSAASSAPTPRDPNPSRAGSAITTAAFDARQRSTPDRMMRASTPARLTRASAIESRLRSIAVTARSPCSARENNPTPEYASIKGPSGASVIIEATSSTSASAPAGRF